MQQTFRYLGEATRCTVHVVDVVDHARACVLRTSVKSAIRFEASPCYHAIYSSILRLISGFLRNYKMTVRENAQIITAHI